MKTPATIATLALLLGAASAQETHAPDGDGFIRHWLVLAPIAVEEGSGSTEIDKDQVKDEEALKPKAGDKAKVAGKELAWKAHKAADFYVDFRESFGADLGEDAAAYAVAYVWSDVEVAGVKLAVGSNDQCKAWLNGKPVLKFTDTRTLEKDTDTADVTLAKGQNVLVLKVINEKNNWQGCARFLKDGAGLKSLKVALAPQ